jgi:hypothetical protein
VSADLREKTAACLDTLASMPIGALDSDGLCVLLQVVGDAIRLGVPIPSAAHARFDDVDTHRILYALTDAAQEPPSWTLPRDLSDSDPHLDWALRRRDELESVIVGARRALIPRGVLPDSMPQYNALRISLASIEWALKLSHLSYAATLRMLGERRELGEWLRPLLEPERTI